MGTWIDIGTRLELFVDNYLIDTMQGARLQLQHPERREIVLSLDQPWENDTGFPNSVVQDGESVRLYYRAAGYGNGDEHKTVAALAESTDGGRSFSRPNLGLIEFNGSKQNNILHIGGFPGIPPAFIDTNPNCKPEERYKGLMAKWRELYAMCSADGLYWQLMQDEPLQMEGAFDTVNTAFWDSLAGCYRSFTRYFEYYTDETTTEDVLGPKPTVVRAIQSSTSQDFIHWTEVVHHQYDDDFGDMQFYTNATIPCPGAEHIYLSFPNRYVQKRTKHPDHSVAGINDAVFMVSRDCAHWKRYPEAWVRPGLDDLNWTDRNNYPTWGLVKTSATEWSTYITEHYRHPGIETRLRRLAIRPHGFVSAHADFDGGEFVTKPFTFGGRQLRLNYSTSAVGSVQIEIQDEKGRPIERFCLDDMEPLFGDELDAPIAWKGGGDLSTLIGKPVRFRFRLKDADVFAFRTVSE